MDRGKLLDRIAALAKEAEGADELPTAGILFALAGAVADGSELRLFELYVPHAAAVVERHSGEVDWGQDLLKA